jgi:hypothetical protein
MFGSAREWMPAQRGHAMNLQLVIIVVGLLATIATSLWGIHINNSRGEKLEAKMDVRFAQIDGRFAQMDAKIDILRTEVNHRFDGLQRDFNQFYLLTGRLEGRIDASEKRAS